MELLFPLLFIGSLIWLIPIIQSGRLFVIAMLVLAVGTVFGPSFFAIDGPIQISLDRILWFAMFAMVAVGWRLGFASRPALTRLDWVVIGIVGWFFLSAVTGGPAPEGSSPIARWLFYIAMPAGMYLLARVIEIRRQDVRWLMGGSIALGLYLAVTALLEINGLHEFVFPKFIVDGERWEFFGRGRGPLLNPSGNGILMSIGCVAAAIGFVYSDRRGKVIFGFLSIVLMAGVYATLTRSAWVGAVCAVAMVAAVYTPRWTRVLAMASILLIGSATVGGLKDELVSMKRDKNLTASDAKKSMELRPLLAIVGWEMFKDRPITGYGFGHYFSHNDPYHNDRSYEMPLSEARRYSQHNVFLSILVDTGLIGLSLFVGWLAMLIGIGWQLARQYENATETKWAGLMLLGAMIAYFCNGMFQDVLIIPMVHMYLFFLAGVAVTVYQKGLAADDSPFWSRAGTLRFWNRAT